MDDRIFLRVLIIAQCMLADQLHENILVVELPDTGIEFQEGVRSGIVGEEQAAIAIADKILVITELYGEIFPDIEIDRPARIEIIHGRLLKRFIITRARY